MYMGKHGMHLDCRFGIVNIFIRVANLSAEDEMWYHDCFMYVLQSGGCGCENV